MYLNHCNIALGDEGFAVFPQLCNITATCNVHLRASCCCCFLVAKCPSNMLIACVSPGQICSHNCMCCHTETEVATCISNFYLSQPQYTDTVPSSSSTDPATPEKSRRRKQESIPESAALEEDALPARPNKWLSGRDLLKQLCAVAMRQYAGQTYFH